MFCTQYGSQITNEAKFCKFCGAKPDEQMPAPSAVE